MKCPIIWFEAVNSRGQSSLSPGAGWGLGPKRFKICSVV